MSDCIVARLPTGDMRIKPWLSPEQNILSWHDQVGKEAS